jgi:acyl carrier protein
MTMQETKVVIERDVRALLEAKLRLGSDQIAGGTTLESLGFDSLGLSDLAEALEEKFGVQVPNRMLPKTLSVNQLVELVEKNVAA